MSSKIRYSKERERKGGTWTRRHRDTQGEGRVRTVRWERHGDQPSTASNHQKLERGEGQILRASERSPPCRHLDFRLWASRPVRRYVCYFKPPAWVICYSSHRGLRQRLSGTCQPPDSHLKVPYERLRVRPTAELPAESLSTH